MLYETDSESSTQDEIYDRCQELDEDGECVDGMRCLGTVFSVSKETNHDLLMEPRVHNEIFLEYPFAEVEKYAIIDSLPRMYFRLRIELLQVRILHQSYYVVIKTYWIRMVQRAWKRVFKTRQEWLNQFKRNPVKHLLQIQRTGYYTPCPSYRGCLFVERH